MPETIKRTVNVEDIRKNDVIEGATVRATHTAHKYVHVYFDGIKKADRYEIGDTVTVERQQMTESERVERHRAVALKWAQEIFDQKVNTTPADVMQDLMDKFHRHQTNHPDYNELLSWSNLPRVMEFQAERQVWLRVKYTLDRLTNKYGESKVDLLTAVASVYMHCQRQLTERHQSPLSRSTSTLSNIFEDLENWAYSEFIDKARMYLGDVSKGSVQAELDKLSDENE